MQKHPRRRLQQPRLQKSARRLCTNLNFRRGEINFLLTTDCEILKLNRRFFAENRPTDVITFASTRKRIPREIDIAISLDQAARQANARGLRLFEETALLMCHGLLHAGGLDDRTEKGWLAMRQAEFASLAKTL
ncbi:MAG: rRNA maturation RNase YbeY [Deltaproteobacteria bacterium]|nr:rRNA maturation RNase YbeY [Deltaproteobacteria bacterium]